MTNDFFKIEIDERQFKTAYLVYVVKLTPKDQVDFYYIGQTGDRNYVTARPAFRRLAGHFSDQGYSTENQIYRQVAVKILGIDSAAARKTFDQQTKDSVSNFLSNCKIEMFVHPLANFLSTTALDNHKANRQFTEKIENELISHFIQQFGNDRLLNKKLPKKETLQFDPITIDIINYIESK
jgi:hypothetical protein